MADESLPEAGYCYTPLIPLALASSSTTIIVLAFIFLAFYGLCSIYIARCRLCGIPGPYFAAYSRLWMVLALFSESCNIWYLETNKKYGQLARIGPNHLLTSDPEIFRHVLGVRSQYERGSWFDSLRINPYRANLITERDRLVHNKLRKQMASGYEGKSIPNFENKIDDNLSYWIEYVTRNALSQSDLTVEFDIARSIQWLMFDMISRLCLGKPLGFVEHHDDRFGFQKTLEKRLPIVEKVSVLSEINLWIRAISHVPLLKRVLPSSRDLNGIGAILRIAERALEYRKLETNTPGTDMVAVWLRNGVAVELLPSEIAIALFAGSDTTATSIRALLLHVISNPVVYTRLTNEISEMDRQGKLSTPACEFEISQLPYMQACIKESLRIFPPITALRERVVPKGGDILGGHFVPGGTHIGLNLPGLLSNEVFGSDAEVFRPERWLEASPEQLIAMVSDLIVKSLGV